jgi:hypothetical protein
MSTRTAKPGTPFRQERFASANQSGLLANLVAKRCLQIKDASERAPIWFIQWLSWQPGGLAAHIPEIFPKKDYQFDSVDELERQLFETCLDGEFPPQYDPDWKLAAAYRARWIQKHSGGVETTVGRKMVEAFANARETRSLVLIQGVSGIGKSHTAREYVHRSGGVARLVNVPSAGDDQSFFRTIATALGLSSSLKLKAVEMRERIEATLCSGDLELIFDQAEFLFPQYLRGYSLPSRLAWIRTALVDRGVPVSLLATPQYDKEKSRTEKLTGWNSSQWTSRISFVQGLPEVLPTQDLITSARGIFPEGNEKTWLALAGYVSENLNRNLFHIEALAKRARRLATQQGRSEATPDDLRNALRENMTPIAIGDSRTLRQPRAAISPVRRDIGASVARSASDNFARLDATASGLAVK